MKTPAEIIKFYLHIKKMSKVDFCDLCHIHRSSLYKYLKGEPIHPLKAYAIEYGTRGEIKAEHLLGKHLLGN